MEEGLALSICMHQRGAVRPQRLPESVLNTRTAEYGDSLIEGRFQWLLGITFKEIWLGTSRVSVFPGL